MARRSRPARCSSRESSSGTSRATRRSPRSSRSPIAVEEIERLADACTRAGMPASAVADARPAPVAQGDLQRRHEPDRRAHRASRTAGSASGRTCAPLVSGLVDEGKAVAAAQGIVLDADPEELIDHAARPDVAYGHKASMLQDVEARRPTEIDYPERRHLALRPRARRADAAQRRRHGADQGSGGSWHRRRQAARAGSARTRTSARRWRSTSSTRSSSRAASTRASRARSRTCPGSRSCTATRTSCVPADGEPFVVFPAEARYVGEHGTALVEQVFDPRPGEAIAARATRRGLDADRRVRARLRDDRARLPTARRARRRPVRRRVRPRPRGEERGRAGVRARLGADQPPRLRDLGRRLRTRARRRPR